ncbi:AAA domain-containing protein [Calditrichota bacterium]
MSLKVFKNKNEPTWAENEFFQYLIEEFKNTNLEIGLFFNVFVNGTELDTLIASEKGLFIIEYKNYSGKLFGSENGDWKILKIDGKEVQINNGRENVFQQLRRQRFSLMNLINEKFNDVFPKYSKESKSTHHIGSYLIFEQLDPASEIKISKKSEAWLKILSKSQTIKVFDHQRPSNLTFKKDEILNLATVLKMEQISISDQDRNIDTTTICPVCFYSTDECNCRLLSGEIVDIENRKITIKVAERMYSLYYNKELILHLNNIVFVDAENNEIVLNDHRYDDTELKILTNVFNYFKDSKLEVPLEVNLFHLKESEKYDFEISDDTLIIILPSWLYSVTAFANLDFCERNVLTQKFSSSPSNHHILRGNAVNESLGEVIENPDNVDNAKEKSKKFVQSQAIELLASDTEPEIIDNAIETEVNKLADWAQNYNRRDNKNTEEFIISTKLGLKGKIDLVLKDDENRIVDILELKSASPDFWNHGIREYHELQVASYGIMVLLRQEKRFQDIDGETPSVLYSQATDNIRKPAKFDSDIFAKVFKYRNVLLNSEFSLKFPNPYPHPMQYHNGCENCKQKSICMDICRTIQYEFCNSSCYKHPEYLNIPTKCKMQEGINSNFIQDFKYWINILNEIRILNHKKYSNILTAEKSTNVTKGKILEFKDMPTLESTTNNKFIYKLSIKDGNYSEFREFDIIVLSDKYNLEKADISLGIIKKLTFENCFIELNKEIKTIPKFIFPYYPDRLEYLNFVGLHKGYFGDFELYKLLSRADDNLKDILGNINFELIQGVPGSGKTTEIVNRIIQISDTGKKVFVATFTNKAIDNIHEKLLNHDSGINKRIYRYGSTYRIEDLYDNCKLTSNYHDTDALKEELKEKTIFLSTLHSANSELVSNLTNYDHVIIDEASQINIPMSFVPMSLSKNILLVGDRFQLSPIFSEEIMENGKDDKSFKSIFETVWHNTEGLLEADKRKNLTNQFRMVEEIAGYPSKIFYSNSIKINDKVKLDQEKFIESFNDEWEKSDLREIINPRIPSIWFQVDSGISDKNFRSNITEAKYCNTIVIELLKTGITPEKIGIISPFRMQVNNIKNKIYSSLNDTNPNILEELQIDTIDRFQGSQKEIVIISLCSNDQKNNFLIKDLRRFNVAITRARFKRIILGDAWSFESTENENNMKIIGIINDGFTKLIKPKK